MTEAISVSALTKRYGEVDAVRGIDFAVAAGETFGFLGPNGAGKSTTIKILCTLADPTSGSARVAGHDVRRERDTVRRNIGLVFRVAIVFPVRRGLPAERPARLPACPPARLPALPACPPARLPACPPARLPACPPARLPACPPARLPAWLTVLTRLDPLTYIVDPMRAAVFGHLSVSPLAGQAGLPRRHLLRLGCPTGTIPGHGHRHGTRHTHHSHSRVPQDRIAPPPTMWHYRASLVSAR